LRFIEEELAQGKDYSDRHSKGRNSHAGDDDIENHTSLSRKGSFTHKDSRDDDNDSQDGKEKMKTSKDHHHHHHRHSRHG
jgi:hypothetical protein